MQHLDALARARKDLYCGFLMCFVAIRARGWLPKLHRPYTTQHVLHDVCPKSAAEEAFDDRRGAELTESQRKNKEKRRKNHGNP